MTESRHSLALAEPLEPRTLMSGSDDLVHHLYYPEGFSSRTISEPVPITNPNSADATYELWARYATGERDQLISSGTIAPHSRAGIVVTNARRDGSSITRAGVGYALELRSSVPLAANLSHYDFGTAIGESFTGTTSTEWTFGDGVKDSVNVRQALVIYNPNNEEAHVTLTAFTESGQVVSVTKSIDALRRGGWNLHRALDVSEGLYGIRVTSDVPIVAALTHYDITEQRGYGSLGQTGGATAGYIASIDPDDNSDDGTPDQGGSNDDDGTPDQGNGRANRRATLGLLNAGDTAATVILKFVDRQHGDTVVVAERTLTVPPGSHDKVDIASLGIVADAGFGVVYESDLPVTVAASVFRGNDAIGVEATAVAATTWTFGEGFMSAARAGVSVFEDLYVFNPGAAGANVTVEFFLGDGRTYSVSDSMDSLKIEDFELHDLPGLLALGATSYFGVRITATVPVVAAFEHWDSLLGGGFATQGLPGGTIVALADILVL
jgi:hypothetical protein